jgi:Fe-S-cluster-containing dehydrogenase component
VGTSTHGSLLQTLLGEQQELPFVERFAQAQSSFEFHRSGLYRELIPNRKLNPGEQLAFQVNLDACTGCKACVSACHSLNGLDEDETWRDVGLLIGHDPEEPYQQHITTACHHCIDPACLNGCPVLAYEKDAVTGIVRHLDDQCIGCQYCILKCPYDVPKYSKKRGIVRKCDMCINRLAHDQAPACVQACPSGAITIQIVSLDSVIGATTEDDRRLVPGAFRSSYTKPTTGYLSRKPVPQNARPVALSTRLFAAGLIAFLLLAIGELAGTLCPLHSKQHPLRASSKIIWFYLPYLAYLRVTCAALAAALGLLVNQLPASFQPWLTSLVCALSLGWILGERYTFFVSAVAPRMPGGVAP